MTTGFISQFKKYTPFCCQTVSCDFDRVPQLKNTTGAGDVFDLTVPRHGDLVKNMYLRFGFTPPTTVEGELLAFVPSVYMFDRFELRLGDVIVETLYPEFINIYYNAFIDFSKKRGNILNTGPLHYNHDTDAILPDSEDSILENTNRNYVLGLPFYFSMESRQSFPLCALTKQELVVRVYMRGLQNIIQFAEGVDDDVALVESLSAVTLTHMYMDIEYVYLSTPEFKFFMENPLTYTLVQTQEERYGLPAAVDDAPVVTTTTIRLEFINPIVEMYMYILVNDRIETNRVDKNERVGTGHTIESIRLNLDGETVIDDTVADYMFLSQMQYMLHHSSVFEHNTVTNNMYVYNYSFSMNPESTCPAGTVNFNMLNNKNLTVNFPTDVINTDKTLFILARSLNMLRIENGTGVLIFKNIN